MKQEHFNDFCELLDIVAEQYSKTLSQNVKALYWQGLHDVEFDAVREALFRHIRNTDKDGDFMPKVSNIRKMLEGSTQDSALIAWSKVDRAMREIGPYQSIVFDDTLIHRVLSDMGGWVLLGTKTDKEWPFVALEFENRYRGYKSRSEKPEYQSHMIGITEMENSKEGYKIEPPCLTGDVNKCQLVYKKGIGQISLTNSMDMKKLSELIEAA